MFTWTPSAAPATNTIGVMVTDDGTPSLSDSTVFTVVVAPLPVVTGTGIHGNEFVFTWTSSKGQRFQVRYKTNLDDSAWQPAGGVIMGDGGPHSFTNGIGSQPQRYFQIEVLP